MMSGGKWTPLKLLDTVALLLMQHGLERETIPQIASNENLRQSPPEPRARPSLGPRPWTRWEAVVQRPRRIDACCRRKIALRFSRYASGEEQGAAPLVLVEREAQPIQGERRRRATCTPS